MNRIIAFSKLIIVIFLFTFIYLSDASALTNKFLALLTLLFSLFFLYKSKDNIPVFIIAFFIFYCNYSIVVGEYLSGGELGAPLYEVKTIEIYNLNIKVLLLFISIISLFYKKKKVDLSTFYLKPNNNILLFIIIYIILIFVLIFGINRSELSSYSIRITPLYEYSTLLFLFLYYTSGKSTLRKLMIFFLLSLFIFQDFYYGGRITSIQLILLFVLTFLSKKLSINLIMFTGIAGIFANSLIGAYRVNYSIDMDIISLSIKNITSNLLIFDTPLYAFYSSATHIAASQLVNINERINTLLSFILSIFIGSNNELSDVTRYVTNNYYMNWGGGVFPSHFFFWLSWGGVILGAILVLFFINKVGYSKTIFQQFISIVVIITVPRWYLYTPLSIFRPIFLLSIVFLIFLITQTILSKEKRKKNIK